VLLNVNLGAGTDILALTKGVTTTTALALPDPLLGAIAINGGVGFDTLEHDATTVTPVNVTGFETVTTNITI
jgi:hypothetical protein